MCIHVLRNTFPTLHPFKKRAEKGNAKARHEDTDEEMGPLLCPCIAKSWCCWAIQGVQFHPSSDSILAESPWQPLLPPPSSPVQGAGRSLTDTYTEDQFLRDQKKNHSLFTWKWINSECLCGETRVIFFSYLVEALASLCVLCAHSSWFFSSLHILFTAQSAFIPHLPSQWSSREISHFFLDGWQHIELQILTFFSPLEVLLANMFVVAPSCILKTGLPVILSNICVK